MNRKLLYQDEAGNKIIIDTDGKLCGLNADREILNPESFKFLLDQSRIKYKVASKTGLYIYYLENE
jgi:hypothetical protein